MGWLSCKESVDAAGGTDVDSASGGRGARGSVHAGFWHGSANSNANFARDSHGGKTFLFVHRYRRPRVLTAGAVSMV